MKPNFDPAIDYYGGGSVGHIDAMIIGKGILRERLERNLANRGLEILSFSSQQAVDLSRAPDFVFWIPDISDSKPHESLLNFIRSLNARLILVFFDSSRDELFDTCIHRDLDVRQVVLHDVYGPGVKGSNLSFIWEKISSGKIVIPENDTTHVIPLYLDDAIDALCQIAFSSQTYNQRLQIAGSDEMTILNFAYKLREGFLGIAGSSPKLEETNASYNESFLYQKKVVARDQAFSLLSWKPDTEMKKGIQELLVKEMGNKKKITLKTAETDHKTELQEQSSVTNSQKKSHWAKRSKTLAMLSGIVLIVSVLLVVPQILQSFIERQMKSSLDNLQSASRAGDTSTSIPLGKRIYWFSSLGIALDPYSRLGWALLGREQARIALNQYFTEMPFVVDIQESFGVLNGNILAVFRSMSGAEDHNLPKIFSDVEAVSTNLIEKLAFAKGSFANADAYREMRQSLSFGRDLLPLGRWALGLDQKRTFALAVENSSELRPTGGFLNAIGFLTMEKGKLIDLSFVDIYQIDSQLTGKEDPPIQIKKVLGESTWLARDANWNPDAPFSALAIEKMIQRATGRTVDGVVFVPTTALKTILSETGPVTISTGEEINASNINEHVTFGDDVNFGTGKQTNVMVETLESLKKLTEGPSAPNVTKGILLALQSGDLIVTSKDPAVAKELLRARIDGSVLGSSCPIQFQTPVCIADSLFVADANLSVNKTDYFLKRERSLRVQISKDVETAYVLMLRYQNTSPTSTRPGGNYRGYTRVYLPSNSTITSIVDVRPESQIEIESDQTIEGDKRVVGFYLDIPYGTSHNIQVTYRGGQPLPMTKGVGSYILLWQKQPGVSDIPISVALQYSADLISAAVSPEAKYSDHSMLFSLTGNKTETIATEFTSL